MVETLELRRMLAYTPTTVIDTVPEDYALFGNGTATNGNLALVPAPQHSSETVLVTGEVSLIDTTDGSLVRTIPNPLDAESAFFGSGVAWVGNKMVIGAVGADRVYVYDDANDTTPEEIENPSGETFSGFGVSMAEIDGDLLVGNGTFNGGPGEVLRFDLDAPGNPHVATYSHNNATNTPDDPSNPDLTQLGTAIAVRSGKIYAAAKDATPTPGAFPGVVVEFDAVADADNNGSFQRIIFEPGAATPGPVPFGNSLAIAGNNLLVGSADAHQVYQIDLGTLVADTYEVPEFEENGLGWGIAVNGAQVALGSLNSTGGATYVYNWSDRSYVATLSNQPEPAESNATNEADNFGMFVAPLPNGGFLVADPADDYDNGSEVLEDAGAVYLFNTDVAPPVNQAPTAEAGAAQTLNENSSVTLDASGSTDPDGGADILAYAWDLDGGTDYETAGKIVAFPSDAPGTYTVKLRVTDSVGHQAFDTVVITLNDILPTADAGADQSTGTNQTVNLSGSGANAAGDAIVAYAWDLDNDGEFDDAFTANTSTSFATGGEHTVSLRVTDDDGQTAVDALIVDATDPAPTAHASADQSAVVTNQTVNLSGSGTAGFGDAIASYAWDLDDNGVFETAGASASTSFDTTGPHTIKFRVTDDDGQTAIDTLIVNVSAFFNNGTGTLFVGGTGGVDNVAVTKSGLTINGTQQPYPAGGRIVVFGGIGNDTITISPNANVNLEAYGGAGNDSIAGGGGNDIIVGGDGNDVLYGGGGLDLLVGGTGADSLYGEANDDVLVGASTAYDGDSAALRNILQQWITSHSVALLGSSGVITSDGDSDLLSGKQGADWFFIDTDLDPSHADVIVDLKKDDDLTFVPIE